MPDHDARRDPARLSPKAIELLAALFGEQSNMPSRPALRISSSRFARG